MSNYNEEDYISDTGFTAHSCGDSPSAKGLLNRR